MTMRIEAISEAPINQGFAFAFRRFFVHTKRSGDLIWRLAPKGERILTRLEVLEACRAEGHDLVDFPAWGKVGRIYAKMKGIRYYPGLKHNKPVTEIDELELLGLMAAKKKVQPVGMTYQEACDWAQPFRVEARGFVYNDTYFLDGTVRDDQGNEGRWWLTRPGYRREDSGRMHPRWLGDPHALLALWKRAIAHLEHRRRRSEKARAAARAKYPPEDFPKGANLKFPVLEDPDDPTSNLYWRGVRIRYEDGRMSVSFGSASAEGASDLEKLAECGIDYSIAEELHQGYELTSSWWMKIGFIKQVLMSVLVRTLPKPVYPYGKQHRVTSPQIAKVSVGDVDFYFILTDGQGNRSVPDWTTYDKPWSLHMVVGPGMEAGYDAGTFHHIIIPKED